MVVNIGTFTPAQIIAGAISGCATFCTSYLVQNFSSAGNISWSFDDGGISNGNQVTHCFTSPGTHSLSVIITNSTGCNSAGSFSVTVYPKPVADFNFAPIKPIIEEEVTFTDASYNNIISWNWYFMNTAQYTSTQQNPTFNYTEPGTYVVALVVKSDRGCLDTLLRELIVGEDFGIYVPNAFTPNGDGLNDVFRPKGFGVTKYELTIFDRWGEKIFHTNTFEEGWNGAKQKNRDVSYDIKIEEGVYTWLITCTSVFCKAHELKGHVTLIK